VIEYFRAKDVHLTSPPNNAHLLYGHVKHIIGRIVGMRRIRIFTDGSTYPGNDSSGVGVYIVDIQTNASFDYSFAITTNGDNLHAEIVALVIATQIGKEMESCDIYSDSQTTLTLLNINRSHRDWLRTPSRGLVSHLVSVLKSNPQIKTHYVRAHTNKKDMISMGNQKADMLAKLATKSKADPLMTMDRGGVYLSFDSKILISGIKRDLARIVKVLRFKAWSKLQHQGQILKQFKHQYADIYKNLIKMMLERKKDKIWSFFILSTLRWITPPPTSGVSVKCVLCSGNDFDNNDHFFACPALSPLHSQAENSFLSCLSELNMNIPAIPIVLQWKVDRFLLQDKLRSLVSHNLISHRHLFKLANIYLTKVFPNPPDTDLFLKNLKDMLEDFSCKCKQNFVCKIHTIWSIPSDLLEIFSTTFNLDTEGSLHPLAITGTLSNFSCVDPKFGLVTKFDMLSATDYPSHSFVHLPEAGRTIFKHDSLSTAVAILKHYSQLVTSESKAIRAIFLLSSSDNKQYQDILKVALELGAKILFKIPKNERFILAYDAYKQSTPKLSVNCHDTYFLIIQNKKAEVTYPVAVNTLVLHLVAWTSRHQIKGCEFLHIKEITDGISWRKANIVQKLESPIALYSRPLPDRNQLVLFMSEQKANYVFSINKDNDSKSHFFAGFFPRSFHNMIKSLRHKSYKEDILHIRFAVLEANCRTFDWYIKMKNFLYRTLERRVKVKMSVKKNEEVNELKSIKKRKVSNVDTSHQDRKKKHKLHLI
jgi:ribonuclease HI